LVNEDTTDYLNPLKVFEKISLGNMGRMAGHKGQTVLDRPVGRRRRKAIM